MSAGRPIGWLVPLVLATGGWVCDDATPCAGALTCPTVTANVCCPQSSPYWCDGKCFDTPSCSDYLTCTYPGETGSGLCTAGVFSATIDSVACTLDPNAPVSAFYDITAAGTLYGCGTEEVTVNAYRTVFQTEDSPPVTSELNCENWTGGQKLFNSLSRCQPRSDTAPNSSAWQLKVQLDDRPAMNSTVDVTIYMDVAQERVHLAQQTVDCPPL
jgi:hypothetical protein